MDLILSHNRPLNAALCDANGKPFYITKTPPGFVHTNTTTVYRVLPEYPEDRKFDLGSPDDGEGDGDEVGGGLHDHNEQHIGLEEMAKIHWKMTGSSIIEYQGKQLDSSEYLRHEGVWGFDRSFIASDGKLYKWVAGITTYSSIDLHRNDEAETPIARHYRSNSGLIGHKHKAHVKIFPEGMPIIDDIVLTFVYMDKVRKTRQNLVKIA